MYFIIRKAPEGRDPKYSMQNPEYRRAYGEAREKVDGMRPRDMSPLRRFAIKQMRFQGKRPGLVAKSQAIRDAMSEEINR